MLAGPLLTLALAQGAAAPQATEITIESTKDGKLQHALLWLPEKTDTKVPLLVLLHTWSGNFRQRTWFDRALVECKKRGIALVHPDFRGRNNRPEACASELAVQDVLDAVAHVEKLRPIDERRIYLAGTSGGGHMALVMATRAPKLWAGVSAWVPITDLAAWHAATKAGKHKRYAKDLERVCGGPPGKSKQVDAQYRRRSSLFSLRKARGVHIDINTGIHDGHTGSVPISQSLLAFNALAKVNGCPSARLGSAAIAELTKHERVPEKLRFQAETPARDHPVLLRKQAGPVRLTIFDGGHAGDVVTALRWLVRQRADSR